MSVGLGYYAGYAAMNFFKVPVDEESLKEKTSSEKKVVKRSRKTKSNNTQDLELLDDKASKNRKEF